MKVPIVCGLILLPFALALVPVGCKPSSPSPDTLCSTATCMVGVDACGKAACMTPPGGGATVCEYAAKLTGSCRCFLGDKRPCGGGTYKTCLSGGTTDTYWGSCS
jgi:hypothetical protein